VEEEITEVVVDIREEVEVIMMVVEAEGEAVEVAGTLTTNSHSLMVEHILISRVNSRVMEASMEKVQKIKT